MALSPAPAAPVTPAALQRERILDAARALFATRGFDEVTMAEVAERAGVARATVFNHFGSKHALVDAITEGVMAAYELMLDAALADATHATPTLIRALFDLMGAGIQGYLGFYRGVFREFARLQFGSDEGSASQRAQRAAMERVTALIERGQARGELSRAFAARDLAQAWDVLANGTITRWLYEDTSEPLRERMQRAAEILLGPVAIGPRAGAAEPLPSFGFETTPRAPARVRQGGPHGARAKPATRGRRRPRSRPR